MGRPKKSIEQHKLDDTFRKDRHGNSVEPVIANALEVPNTILPPNNITDTAIIDHYQHHVQLLIKLNILTYSDIPEINMMYEALQEYKKIYTELQKLNIINDSEKYEMLSNRLLRFGQRFSNLAVKYCISPVARNKLTLEALQIKKEVEEQKSITAKLINKKKA
jgi:phage terminase small subunit